MAYLDSGDEAALAFAQVSTMIEFLLSRGGADALPKLMDKVRGGQDSFEATAELAGYSTFEEFRQAWMEWLRTLPLIEEQLAALPVVLQGQGDEFASDPLLSEKPELARYARVGDLLREAGRPRAALVEYAKAEDPEGPPSPLLIVRRALCHEALGEKEQALRQVEEGAGLYPEFSTIQVVRGRLLDGAGRREEALEAWRAAHEVNPYDPEVQRALVSGYQAIGKVEQAQRHLRYSRILATGGAIAPSAQ
jgi:tetratricopeptide (TPR) repeat protein